MSRYNLTTAFILSMVAILLFIPGLGWVHLFDWDEVNFAEAAREMIVTGNWSKVQINYEPFWEKPPLFIWLQALSMKLFGVNEFSARLPTVFSAVITLNFIYFIGLKYFRPGIAQWWVMAYLAALFPQFYFRTGLIDPTFNLFIFAAVHQLAKAYHLHQKAENNSKSLVLSCLFIGLAILTKGPAALLIYFLVILGIIIANRGFFFSGLQLLVSATACILVSSIWFLPETIKNGPWFIKEFIQYQLELVSQDVAGHAQPWFYHPLVLFFGCVPISVLGIKGMLTKVRRHRERSYYTVYHILFWVVLVVFSIVKTKIIHYSSLCWLPLTFLSAYALDTLLQDRLRLKKAWKWLWFFSLAPLLVIQFLFAFIFLWGKTEWVATYITDPFALAIWQVPASISSWKLWTLLVLVILLMVGFVRTWFSLKRVFFFFVLFIINTMMLALIVVPFVNAKLQAPLFSFYQSLEDKEVYVETMHFKSYAHYFYPQINPLTPESELNVLKDQFMAGQKWQNLSSDSVALWKQLKYDFHRADPRDKDIYLIYKVGHENTPNIEEGFFELKPLGAYRVFLRKRRELVQ